MAAEFSKNGGNKHDALAQHEQKATAILREGNDLRALNKTISLCNGNLSPAMRGEILRFCRGCLEKGNFILGKRAHTYATRQPVPEQHMRDVCEAFRRDLHNRLGMDPVLADLCIERRTDASLDLPPLP